jgi:hypothetical protein
VFQVSPTPIDVSEHCSHLGRVDKWQVLCLAKKGIQRYTQRSFFFFLNRADLFKQKLDFVEAEVNTK